MDHEEATRVQACSRYLAGELPPNEEVAFEDHFFSCEECAQELKAGALFGESVRAVFHDRDRELRNAQRHDASKISWIQRLRSSFALPFAFAACALLALAIYQNAIVLPGMRSQLAVLSTPQAVAWVPLKLSRGDDAFVIPKDKTYWMAYFLLPNSARSSSYICEIENSAGKKVNTVKLSPPEAGQPSSILLRRSEFPTGLYTFRIYGQHSNAPLATYTIELNTD